MSTQRDFEILTKENQIIIFAVTRAINCIGIILYILLFIAYIKGNIEKNFTMAITIQFCIAQFLYNISNCIPLINTIELEESWLCTFQTIISTLSIFSSITIIMILLFVSYMSVYHQEFLEKNKFKFQIWICVGGWLFSSAYTSIFFFLHRSANLAGFCRGGTITGKLVFGAYFLVMLIIAVVLLCFIQKAFKYEEGQTQETMSSILS